MVSMSNLSQLLEPETRSLVLKDLSQFVDKTVAEQSGISGMAIKGAVSAAIKVSPDFISRGLNKILPDMLGDLEPYWSDFESSDSQDFGTFLDKDSAAVADALMSTADQHAKRITIAPVAKAYKSLRNKGASIVEGKVADLGSILHKHMN